MNPTIESVPVGFDGSQVAPTSFAKVRIDPAHPASLAVHSGVMRLSNAHPSNTSAKCIQRNSRSQDRLAKRRPLHPA